MILPFKHVISLIGKWALFLGVGYVGWTFGLGWALIWILAKSLSF